MLVLIVGDKEAERAILRVALTRLGHPWREAADGDAGWLAYLDCQPAVILTDFIMPGKNGLELTRAVREHPFDHYTYIAILSTIAQKENIFNGLRAGADDYLSKPVDLHELELRLLAAARVSELHSRLAKQKQDLQKLSDELYLQSRRDALTHAGNRSRFHDDTPEFLAHYADGEPCVAALCDIDCFKQYNDIYGHFEGDKILKVVAHSLKDHSAHDVLVYRFGGEEFLLLFPNRTAPQAHAELETLREHIYSLGVVHVGNKPYGQLSVTFGLAPLPGGTPGDLERALKEADHALYEGKRAGRNRTHTYGEFDGAEPAHTP